jgi:hypothetical protein
VAPAARATLSDLAWLAGHWVGGSDDDLSEEIWASPHGDGMMGMCRFVSGGKARVLELLSITDEASGPVMRLRHFDAKLVAWEEKDRAVSLPLIAWKESEATFEGPDSLRSGTVRITYRRVSADELTAALEKASGRQEFRFRRKRP